MVWRADSERCEKLDQTSITSSNFKKLKRRKLKKASDQLDHANLKIGEWAEKRLVIFTIVLEWRIMRFGKSKFPIEKTSLSLSHADRGVDHSIANFSFFTADILKYWLPTGFFSRKSLILAAIWIGNDEDSHDHNELGIDDFYVAPILTVFDIIRLIRTSGENPFLPLIST